MCGANGFAQDGLFLPCGSSPRVRGEPLPRQGRGPALRIIPACAGRTHGHTLPEEQPSDHPRVCVANGYDAYPGIEVDGSSPRVRGERKSGLVGISFLRIIPACAGRTSPTTSTAKAAADHPRVCGANPERGRRRQQGDGSSPRVRGKRPTTTRKELRVRIIPACAGQTNMRPERKTKWADHPRVCGANVAMYPLMRSPCGSSPRVRGKQATGTAADIKVRIIPACAGQTPSCGIIQRRASDHPRVCGANLAQTGKDAGDHGSSPRVRGKPVSTGGKNSLPRIIPACAGQTHSPVTR